ncbi:hypothetical protein WL557_12700, partial [Staphylococcus lugdunensis]
VYIIIEFVALVRTVKVQLTLWESVTHWQMINQKRLHIKRRRFFVKVAKISRSVVAGVCC